MTGEPAPPPGTVAPRRVVPHLHWELLVCGLRGHELVGTRSAEVRPQDALVVLERDGVRWHRCLRCDSWLPLAPPGAPEHERVPPRESIDLPRRGKALRDRIVLRIIAVDRALHFLVLMILGIAVLVFAANQGSLRDEFHRTFTDLQAALGGGPFRFAGDAIGRLDHLFSIREGTLHLVGAALIAYGCLEGAEAVGLWLGRRWAEYLTLIATTAFLPWEIDELFNHLTWFKVVAFVLNVAVVLYLLWAKRLFGIRGGAAAEEAARARDMGWPALERATPWAAELAAGAVR